jgi:sulfonate transport system permease protein
MSLMRLRRLIVPAAIVVLWWILVRWGHMSQFILPAPGSVLTGFADMVRNGDLLFHTCASLRRSIGGFALGSFLGIVSGMVIGWSTLWDDLFDLPVNFVRSIPKTALAPLFIVWFGLGDWSKILLIAFSSYFFTVIPTIEGVKNVDKTFIKSARSMKAKEWQIIITVLFPAALPSIFAGVRLAMTTSLLVLVMAEVMAGSSGLGYLLETSRGNLDLNVMFATLLILGALGYAIDLLMKYLSKVIMPWRKGKTLSE